jgi:N-methylhydantoinase B/oxoprolinase/acetone carboxylase alpha subunit
VRIEDLVDQVMEIEIVEEAGMIEDLVVQVMVIEIQADLVVQVMVDEGEIIEDLEGMRVHHDRMREVTEELVKEEVAKVDVEILDLIGEVQDQVSQDLTILKIEDKIY